MSIEKFSGKFDRERGGCSIIVNETIQSIVCTTSLAIYVYLLSKPDDWRLNVKELSNHFSKNKETIYKYLNNLIDIGAIEKVIHRESGKFESFNYKIKLHLALPVISPVTEKPYTVKPYTVNPDAYKTKSKQNKELTNNIFKQKSYLIDVKKIEKKPKALELITNDNPHNLPDDLIRDFIEVRKAKHAPLTKTAVKQLNNELDKCVNLGINPVIAVELAVSNGWVTIKAEWINKSESDRKRTYGNSIDPIAMGLPTHMEAYKEAIKRSHPSSTGETWSNAVVYHAWNETGSRPLHTAYGSYQIKEMKNIFYSNYNVALKMFAAGEPLRELPKIENKHEDDRLVKSTRETALKALKALKVLEA